MAHPTLADAHAYLATFRGVTIFDGPDERAPEEHSFINARTRCYAIRASGGAFDATFHIDLGENLPLALGVSMDEAYAGIAAHVERTTHIPGWYAPEHDVVLRGAAAEALHGTTFGVPGTITPLVDLWLDERRLPEYMRVVPT